MNQYRICFREIVTYEYAITADNAQAAQNIAEQRIKNNEEFPVLNYQTDGPEIVGVLSGPELLAPDFSNLQVIDPSDIARPAYQAWERMTAEEKGEFVATYESQVREALEGIG